MSYITLSPNWCPLYKKENESQSHLFMQCTYAQNFWTTILNIFKWHLTFPREEDETDESTTMPVQLGLIFSHTEKYPDEPPLLNVKSIRGIPVEDLKILREKLQQEASENLGMAMVYTLVTSSKEWLSERFGQESSLEIAEAEERAKEDIIVPHGEPVTLDTFLAWREKFEAEMALERAKIMPESALSAPKEKKLTGRQWFESGRASTKGAAPVTEGLDEEDDEDIDFDEDDFEDDEEDMLEHFLAEKSESSSHSSRRP
ncbi:RWD domain-containing protein 1-like isoform X1 [Cucurbita maxima]|uniref:RWD domain-containing protein 1-like isoform X1 n=1 Tax=Cucurbita maxima TaxID=3661 RepID=A0A6J1JPL3_CUCMA|nr:RWD domain-containing protein 1-like isoform X1 [Cucurbita maxima]XP_022992362.1 RWD domain-containing protein 1-like isoform X1 [Cucurbita maxima]XP_022992363.1 RWD domain-containing protein 1-like isoform X1 [Cucurbita maxima]XP_022992364.1 RWD domain-containing protein 1-like isoform X1 [Cucurbita maxima]